MSEYISREAVMDAFAQRVKQSNNSDFAPPPTWNNAVEIVEQFPAADVVEVRHAHWDDVEVIECEAAKLMVASMRCSACNRYHNEVYHYGNPTEMAHYCGFCGAKMDEEGEE